MREYLSGRHAYTPTHLLNGVIMDTLLIKSLTILLVYSTATLAIAAEPRSGRIASHGEVLIKAAMAGVVDKTSLKLGDKVTQGSALVRFDCRRNLAQVATAKAKLAIDQAEKNSVASLFQSKVKTRHELNISEANVAIAKAQLYEADIAAKLCYVRAPIPGIVAEKFVSLGQYVQAGDDLYRLVDDEKLYAVANVNRRFWNEYKIGDQVTLRIENAHPQLRKATVVRKANYINKNFSFEIEMKLENVDGLVSGMAFDLNTHPNEIVKDGAL